MKPNQKLFEGLMFLFILYSIVIHFIELETDEPGVPNSYFFWSEVLVGTVFTIEYVVRWVASRSWRYPFQPLAIVDLLAVLPFYLGFFVDLRALRLVRAMRILRLLKLYRYTNALRTINNAFHRIRYEFAIIGFALLTLGWLGSVAMFELERERQPEVFGRLSDAAWYTIVTFTTVGYGDKVPMTPGGKITAFLLMLSGLGLFGTFVSLVGSAFLEELRKTRSEGNGRTLPPELVAMSGTNFDPEPVLAAIRDGRLEGSEAEDGEEAARLLAIACELLVREREPAKP
jgi:voltage-gated potassium channel